MSTPTELEVFESTIALQNEDDKEPADIVLSAPPAIPKRGLNFWMTIVSNLLIDFLGALDMTAVSTALPTIVNHLHGNEFIWAGSAYIIASTAVVPTVGGMVSVFGRKPVMLAFVFLFAVGSAISGAAQSMDMLIIGRVIQGLGNGGCDSVTTIINTDLIPLPERGKFSGITASVWALACVIGPPIGGAFASSGAWRWLFFMNLPLCAISAVVAVIFSNVYVPKTSLHEKVAGMDWLGLPLIISSTTTFMIALVWAGVRYPWNSIHVLVPLCLGAVGIISFFITETFWIKEPTVPRFMFTNRTTFSGYLGTFFHGIASMAVIFYLPVYFQGSRGASAIGSGADFLGLSLLIPIFAVLAGTSVQILRRYRPQNYVGWILIIIGFGLLSILDIDTPKRTYIGLEVVMGAGMGALWTTTQFPIVAPLPYSNNAHAIAFFYFVRYFAQNWGIVIGGAILQNQLRNRLPAEFIATLPSGAQLAYSIIPKISHLPDPLKAQVQSAFAASIALIWRVMIGVSALGLLSCLLMKEVEMRKALDETWGLQEKEPSTNGDEQVRNGA